jgi:hypothetical protein
MRGCALALVVVVAACGDNPEVIESIDAVSGARIKLERWLYEDGTTHVDPSGFYDIRLSTRCTARTWGDDLLRCVPVAGEALYTDASCTTVVGMAGLVTPDPEHVSDSNVSHFIGYDWIAGEPRPTRLYSAGDPNPTTPVSTYYSRRNGQCQGPFGAPGGDFYAITSELAPTIMPVLEEAELGADRLGLRVLTTTDGLRVPIGLHDRALDMACNPAAHGESVVCEPSDAAYPTDWFEDAECTAPVILVFEGDPMPQLVRTIDEGGCPIYAPLGDDISTPLYYASAGGCVRSDPGMGFHRLRVGAAVDLPLLDREVVDAQTRRLAEMTLTDAIDPTLRFTSDRLLDRAIRAECRREQNGDVAQCIPAVTTYGFTLYESGCTIPVPVVELPQRTCTPITFARMSPFEAPTWHAIGDPVRRQLHSNNGSCSPYVSPSGRELRALGPALPDDTFVHALKYGER